MKTNFKKALHFIVGTFRYKLFYSRLDFLLSRRLKNQIQFRIDVMDRQCYDQGSCKICGCNTTALQMANKQCPKPCYPPFMPKKQWFKFWVAEQKTLAGNDWWKIETSFDMEEDKKLYRTLILYKNDRVISSKRKLHRDYAKQ